jgi:hypothetical protein
MCGLDENPVDGQQLGAELAPYLDTPLVIGIRLVHERNDEARVE